MLLVEVDNLAMEEIYRAKHCEMQVQEISLYGRYPKYLFFGDIMLEGITYFDARKIYRHMPISVIRYYAKKIIKTYSSSYGKSYYHIEGTDGKSWELILDLNPGATIIEE